MDQSADSVATIRLEPILDFRAAMPLRDAFLDRRGENLRIDASHVTQLGGLCLQVLIAAHHAWRSDCLDFHFTGRSDDFDAAVALFGAGKELGLHNARDN